MKRWHFEIGGLVFAAFMVLALLMVVASIVGHVAQTLGWI